VVAAVDLVGDVVQEVPVVALECGPELLLAADVAERGRRDADRADAAEAGQVVGVQFRLDFPVALVKDDRFVIRSYSPVYTIGGGGVLNPIPQKHKRFKADVIQGLKGLVDGPPEEIIPYHIEQSGYHGRTFSDLRIMSNISEKHLDRIQQDLMAKQVIRLIDKDNRIFIHGKMFDNLKQEITGCLSRYHTANPLKTGMPKEELKSKLPSDVSPRLFNMAVNQMINDGSVVLDGDMIRLKDHVVSLGVDQADVKTKIMETYRETGLQPPYFKDLSKLLSIDPSQARDVLRLLTQEDRIIKAKEDLYFDAEAVNELKKKLVSFLESNGEIGAPQFKEMTGVSRKYMIPLLEYFDNKQVTIRIGDVRRLRKG